MTLVQFSPAPYHLVAAMIAQSPATALDAKPIDAASAAKFNMLSSGPLSWGFYAGEECVACAGLASLASPSGQGAPSAQPGEVKYEAWFLCFPSAARHMRAFLHIAQLTLREYGQDAIVEARVTPGWRPGEKIAWLLGFKHHAGDIWRRCGS